MSKPYTLHQPEKFIPLVFDSPHSGQDYPDEFNYACEPGILEKAEDKYVDDLFSEATNAGAPAPWPEHLDITPSPSNRSYAGIGLIRRLVQPGIPVYDHDLSPEEGYDRIQHYYRPYHEALSELINRTHYHYGQVWHINCHSMPSSSSKQGALGRVNPFSAPDFVLGDRDGTSCALDFTHSVRDFLTSLGYKVAINDPYKGVELVRKYSSPSTGRHSLQIEICRSLYLNEETYEKSKNYAKLKNNITALINFCADYASNNLIPLAAD